MDEREFNQQADAMLAHIEQLLDACPADLDIEVKPGGIIEVAFDDPASGKIIINRHTAAREIWLAAKSGGFHFKYVAGDPARWVGTRDGVELLSLLARCIGEQSGVVVTLADA